MLIIPICCRNNVFPKKRQALSLSGASATNRVALTNSKTSSKANRTSLAASTATSSVPTTSAFHSWLIEWQRKNQLSPATVREIELNTWFARQAEKGRSR